MCTFSRPLEDHNFSPDSVFSTFFPGESFSLDPSVTPMDAAQNPVSHDGSETPNAPDGSSLATDSPAETLVGASAASSAEPSSSLAEPLPPPLKTLDETLQCSDGDLLEEEPSLPFSNYASSTWATGWSGHQSPRNELPDDSSKQSPPAVEDEDQPEDPFWLHTGSPLRSNSPESYLDDRWPSSNRGKWPHTREPMHSNFQFSSTEPTIVPTGVGAGLRNLGNTCFLNVVLQCFTHTVPLIQGLRSFNHLKKPCERGREGFCVFCFLCGHIEDSLSSSGRTIAPVELVDNLSNISSFFQRYQQEDAHEFLQCLLDRLDTCCLESKTNDDMPSLNYKLVDWVFGGRLLSKLRCCNCSHFSNTYEPLIDLSLEIGDVDSLPSALESFTKVERIEDPETKFTCENCKEVVTVEKQLILDQAPSVATFHLKRFKADGSSVVKIDKHVEYPLELDLSPYTCGSLDDNVELKYELYAVVVHVGLTPSSGHYFCFVRSSPETWHRLDDSKVYRVQENYVLSQDAYILFYARQGTPWFSSLMESPQTFLKPNISNESPKSVLDNLENTSCPSAVNSDICDDHEMQDAFNGISTAKHEEAADNETIEMRDASERISTVRLDDAKINEIIGDAEESRQDASVAFRASSSCVGTANYQKISMCSNDRNPGISGASTNDIFHSVTPPVSPSPTKTSDGGYCIPRGHLRTDERRTCKRQLSKDLEVSKERKEAFRYLSRSGGLCSRRLALAAAAHGNHNEGKRKKMRTERSPIKVSPRNTRHKSRHRTAVH